MSTELTDLTRVLEEEISVGEELWRNLSAQKQAIVALDVAELLVQINAREPWLRSLGEFESRRCRRRRARTVLMLPPTRWAF